MIFQSFRIILSSFFFKIFVPEMLFLFRQALGGNVTCQEIVPLQPPSGFSDGQELSEAECDREPIRERFSGLPLFRHEELEQELSTLVKK